MPLLPRRPARLSKAFATDPLGAMCSTVSGWSPRDHGAFNLRSPRGSGSVRLGFYSQYKKSFKFLTPGIF